jgi:excisionase family DNA binding protein
MNRTNHKSRPLEAARVEVPRRPRYTVADAAVLMGISRSLVYQRIREGKINSVRDGARRFITAAEVRRYANGIAPSAQVGG